MYILKPHDIVTALKIGRNEQDARLKKVGDLAHLLRNNTVGELAEDLEKGKGDISRSINRLIQLGLIAERRRKADDPAVSNRKFYSLNRRAMVDLLIGSIRHIFAPEKKGYGRGFPTGWNCPQIKSPMNPPDMPLVWPTPGGQVQGEYIEPLYPKCPEVAEKDEGLYQLLALIDVVRIGKPRELQYAKELLETKIMELYS
ncbi:winged helix-turn-helix domain-containing protein [Hahella ganghwensis]|uniref:winged helix-turn-helix domain-containing protein n=1 Tax=Hahella ganghwensis TaxID=286420 RepID=UPI00037C3F83|nr:winged helix-turn-helix domain-containing protein [Hahella ganghwensis]